MLESIQIHQVWSANPLDHDTVNQSQPIQERMRSTEHPLSRREDDLQGLYISDMSRRSRLTTFHDLQLLVMLKSIVMRLVYVEWHYHKIHGYVSIYKSKEAHPVTRVSRITAGTSPTTWCPQVDRHLLTCLAFPRVISLHPKRATLQTTNLAAPPAQLDLNPIPAWAPDRNSPIPSNIHIHNSYWRRRSIGQHKFFATYIFFLLQGAFQLSDPPLAGLDLSSSASHFSHAVLDLSPVTVAPCHAPCWKGYWCRALYHQFQYLYQCLLEQC